MPIRRNQQNLHQFSTEFPWKAHQRRQKRLALSWEVVGGRSLLLLSAETGDWQPGNRTDDDTPIHRERGQARKWERRRHGLGLRRGDDAIVDR